jgi:hypothetical protein
VIDVEVKNFQSIEHAAIQIQGFTALVGRSNIGKSAIVRAVKAALTGAPSTSFVRHTPGCPRKSKGAKTCKCHCSVHLKAENFDLLWEKGDAINRYTFNGQIYDKAERGTPDFLQPAYAPVKIGDDKELLQVADQFDPIFLLNQTGGVIADVLSDVAHLDRVNVATRLSEKDRREATATRKVREQDVVTLTQRLVLFDGLDSALATCRDVEDYLDVVEAAERNLATLDVFLERGAAIGFQMQVLEQAMLLEAPASAPLSSLSERHARVARFLQQLTERALIIRALQAIEGVMAPEPDPLQRHAATFSNLDGWITKLRVFKAWMERTKVLDAAPAVGTEQLAAAMTAYVGLAGLAERHTTLTTLITTLSGQQTAMEAEGLALQAEWDALGVCPTCTQPFHAGGHGPGV